MKTIVLPAEWPFVVLMPSPLGPLAAGADWAPLTYYSTSAELSLFRGLAIIRFLTGFGPHGHELAWDNRRVSKVERAGS